MTANDPKNDPKTGAKSKRPTSFDEAMKVLDDALSGNTEELKDLVSDELQSFKREIGEFSEGIAMGAVGARLRDLGDEAITNGQKIFREATGDINARVRANPWPAIGGIAVGTFALGYFLGKNFLKERSKNLAKDLVLQ